ncbi:MAG: phosphoribosyltransferase family protein [Acidimicrobiia bacterium]
MRRPVAAAPPEGVDAWVAPFAYEGIARELVARIKYRNTRAVVPWLADEMCVALALPAIGPRRLLLTWAPTSRARARSRGFDPGEVLARAVGRSLGLPCVATLTHLPGPPQTGRVGAERRQGPRIEPRHGQAVSARLAGVAVLLVDDVATTGATLVASARALRLRGARRVVALTAARTPPPR